MAEQPTSNVKIYDRPARTGPSPLILVIALLIVLALGFVAYRAFRPAATNPPTGERGTSMQISRPVGNG